MKIAIKKIRTDGGTQSRATISSLLVKEYVEDMKRGDKFPPIEIAYDGTDYWLVDGFHRLAAAVELGRRDIEVHSKPGDRRDAILRAASANVKNGFRRTNADKRRAVEMILDDKEWRQWSDRKIAEAAGVTHPFVSEFRKAASGNDYQAERLAHRNGTTYSIDVSRIGGGGGELAKAARDLIVDTPLRDNEQIVYKLGLEPENLQVGIAKLLISGEVKTVAQGKRMVQRRAKQKEWGKLAKSITLTEKDCKILVGDCRQQLQKIDDNSIDLVVTDPPYGIGDEYNSFDDRLTREQLIELIGPAIQHVARVLKPTGTLYFIINSKRMFDAASLIEGAGLHIQTMIPWCESFASHNPKFFTDAYRPVFMATKHPTEFTFNHEDIRTYIPSSRLENTDGREDPDGKLPPNVWGVWTDKKVHRVVDNAGESVPDDRVPNQLPLGLVERCVLLSSLPGETVLDPFSGTGSVGCGAIVHKRRYVGIEVDPEIAEASRDWIKSRLHLVPSADRKAS